MTFAQFFAGMGLGIAFLFLAILSRSIAIFWIVRKKKDLIDKVCGIIEDETLDSEERIHAFNKAGVTHIAFIQAAHKKLKGEKDGKKRGNNRIGRFGGGGSERDVGRGRAGEKAKQIETEASGEIPTITRREEKGFFPKGTGNEREPAQNDHRYARKWSL